MSDQEHEPVERIVTYYLRIYKHNHIINYQLFLSEKFGRTLTHTRDFRFDQAVYHIVASVTDFSDEQLAAAVHWYHERFVAPLLRQYPKETDDGHTYQTVKDRKGS